MLIKSKILKQCLITIDNIDMFNSLSDCLSLDIDNIDNHRLEIVVFTSTLLELFKNDCSSISIDNKWAFDYLKNIIINAKNDNVYQFIFEVFI